MWKVRYVGPDGDLHEAEHSGDLTSIATAFDEATIRVIQHVAAPAGAAQDQARGASSMAVEKSDA